jgi:hypothetical protein
MLFGNLESFALEAITEPGPELPSFFGSNVTGRFRLFIGGLEVGKFAEPGCVLRPLSQHLVAKCAGATALWHESLAGETPDAWFKLLDDALYIIGTPEPPDAYYRMDFLTNVSEALNNVKGFLVAPPGEALQALLQLPESEAVHHKVIPLREFCAVSSQFAAWVGQQEHELLQGSA